ncbi:hypothetical protein D3C86_1340170 [compost metagenome]
MRPPADGGEVAAFQTFGLAGVDVDLVQTHHALDFPGRHQDVIGILGQEVDDGAHVPGPTHARGVAFEEHDRIAARRVQRDDPARCDRLDRSRREGTDRFRAGQPLLDQHPRQQALLIGPVQPLDLQVTEVDAPHGFYGIDRVEQQDEAPRFISRAVLLHHRDAGA